jgi:hypothetical protein
VKQDVGYRDSCTICQIQATQDAKLIAAVESKEDPVPYLHEMYDELVKTRAELVETRKDLAQTATKMQPIEKLRQAVYWGVGAGMFTLAISILKLVFGLP